MEYTKAEALVIKHFGAEHKRRTYVILGVGLINWVAGAVYGHYLEVPEKARIYMQEFRDTMDEPRFRRNGPQFIASILLGILRASHQGDFGLFPDAEWTKVIGVKAVAVQRDYLKLFPSTDED